MKYKILLLDSVKESLEKETNELTERGLDILSAGTFEEACNLLKKDGGIHVILTEPFLPLSSTDEKHIEGPEMFRAFLHIRYEILIYLFTMEQHIGSEAAGGMINGYFYKGDKDYDDVIHKIKSEVISTKNRAPFFEKLVHYSKRTVDAWHTPGHSSGYSVKTSPWVKDFYEFFGPNLFKCDVSVSVPMLDSLLQPTGVIKDAQELAACAFSARYTFFCTNGTSTANKILLQTLLKPGDSILLDRNCHKSVHHGVIISGAEPIYLLPSVNSKYGIFGPVPKKRIIETMDKALSLGKKLKALILTNCTYDGLIYDIADIVKEAHKRNIKVIVDEAWFGYARFHHEFYPCAMEAGADYSTQSTHKTMSSFSQASMIHVNDPDFESIKDFFMENFCLHTSTSPQYTMIASLDVARKQMVMEGYSLLSRSLELSSSLCNAINSLEKFKVLELEDMIADEIKNDNIRLDKTKLTIDISKSGFTGKEVEYLLAKKYDIQIEKSTFNTLTILITIGSTQSKLNRLFFALESLEHLCGNISESTVGNDFKLSLSPMRFKPRAAYYCDGEKLHLSSARGRVCTSMIVPYPPGIPILVPGQLITDDIVNELQTYREYNVEIHGLSDSIIKVMTEEEEKDLARKGYAIKDVNEI